MHTVWPFFRSFRVLVRRNPILDNWQSTHSQRPRRCRFRFYNSAVGFRFRSHFYESVARFPAQKCEPGKKRRKEKANIDTNNRQHTPSRSSAKDNVFVPLGTTNHNTMASEQIMTCSREAGSPVVIPLHKDGGVEDGGLPEWAMIELNGELIAPSTSMPATDKENPDSLLQSDQVELGSVRFVNNVSAEAVTCIQFLPRACLAASGDTDASHTRPCVCVEHDSTETRHASGHPRAPGTRRRSQSTILRPRKASQQQPRDGLSRGGSRDAQALV
jgi:hypothetical protein